jgi:hypothetical protein
VARDPIRVRRQADDPKPIRDVGLDAKCCGLSVEIDYESWQTSAIASWADRWPLFVGSALRKGMSWEE